VNECGGTKEREPSGHCGIDDLSLGRAECRVVKDLGVGEIDRLLPLERLLPLAARALTRSTRVVLLDHCARRGVVSGLKLSLGEEA